MKSKRYFSFFLSIFLIIINLGIYIIITTSDEIKEPFFYSINLFSVISFIILFFCIVQQGGLVSIHSIIHFFYFLFLYGRSIYYIIYPSPDFFETELLVYEYIGIKNLAIALICANLVISIINSIYFLFGIKEKYTIKSLSHSDILKKKLVFNSLILFSFLYAFKLFLEFKYVLNAGYITIYIGGLKDVNYYSFLIQYSQLFFLSLFSYYLILNPSKRSFLKIGFLYLILSLLDSLKGARVTFILPLFYIIWYYFNVFNIKINYKIISRAVIFFVFLLFFSFIISNSRNKGDYTIKDNIVKSAILETGSTLQVVGRYIKNKKSMAFTYPYILEPIVYPYFYLTRFSIMVSGQSESMLLYRNSLNHQLTAKVDINSYLNGRGLGSSIVAEFYQYGIIVLVLLSLIYGFFLILLYKKIFTSTLLYLSPLVLTHFFFISRDTAFPNLIELFKALLMLFIIKSFVYTIISLKVTFKRNIHNMQNI